jgi:diguanylate cyclase (GGDEF)-like protein
MLLGSGAALLGARSIAHGESERARLSFHLAAEETASTLQLAIQREEDLVLAGSTFVGWNSEATPAQFDRWASAVGAMRRYPELLDLGLVRLVPAARLDVFRAHLAKEPVEPFGAGTGPSPKPFEVLPAGTRPYYCFATAGITRTLSTYLPAGLDYCALARPSLLPARDTGQTTYAPFPLAGGVALGVQTPVYRHGTNPTSLAGRRRAFVGWLGELLAPSVVLTRALQGHPGMAVVFSYAGDASPVVFTAGHASAGGQRATIDLHNGWSVQSIGAPLPDGVLTQRNAWIVLLGGALLSVLLAVLVFVLGTSRERARALVREQTRELTHLALHDTLTGLPNRALVLDRAEQMLARVERRPGSRAGALFVDVDGFKHVNDRLGHAAGDTVLRTVGERLGTVVRGEDTVGRLAGDEFVVLVEAASGGPPPELLADRLLEALREPIELDGGGHVTVTASVGLAVGRYASPDGLLRDADLALYAAKAEGRDRFVLFDPRLGADADDRVELELALGSALERDELFLLYQPIFQLPRRRVVAVEALLRWRHPTRGVVTPDVFIPLAEDSGLIVPIGRWVLREACRQAAEWNRDGTRLGVSVNVSARQLGRESFTGEVAEALRDSGLKPRLLTLEITETTLMSAVAGAEERLAGIRELGVGVAIDDFGTGYASLSNLQRMPVDVLKVDRSFVAALNDGGQSRELLEAILGVGQALSLRVVAEGIEMTSQMTTLEEMGCEMAQGFLMGRPGPPEAIAEILGSEGALPAAPA